MMSGNMGLLHIALITGPYLYNIISAGNQSEFYGLFVTVYIWHRLYEISFICNFRQHYY